MIEMRWLRRDQAPDGEARDVLQFRESRRRIFRSHTLGTHALDVFDGVEWQDVPIERDDD